MKLHLASILFLPFAVTAADTNGLPMLAPAYGEIPPTFWEQHGTAMLIGGFVLVVLAALLLWRLFQPKPPMALPPEVLAREALARLQPQPEDGKTLSEVSQILRHYIGTAFNLPNSELTTAEFCNLIAQKEELGTDLAGAISSFLRECDVKKFSPVHASSPLNATERALRLVDLAEAHRISLKQTTPPHQTTSK